jgi:uncharacterized OsmC-like protein
MISLSYKIISYNNRNYKRIRLITKLHYNSRSIYSIEKIDNNNNSNDEIVVINNIDDDYSLISSYNSKTKQQVNATPKELLLSALASCTIMTIRTFYNNCIKNNTIFWSNSILNKIEVHVKENNDLNKHIPNSIDITIKLIGNLTNEQKERLLIISNQCPIKKMIATNINSYIV